MADAEALATRAHASGGQGTAYLEFPDFSLPPDHPRLHFADYAVRAVPYDLMPFDSPLRRLYEWDPLKDLVEAVLDRGPVFRYADPFGALNLAVMGQGDQLQWHFDQTDFVVSLAIQSAESGGRLRGGAPAAQSATTSATTRWRPCSPATGPGSRCCRMTPGTLLVFEGRHSLHRVSPVAGSRFRHVGLLAYDTEPGTVGSDLLRAEPLRAHRAVRPAARSVWPAYRREHSVRRVPSSAREPRPRTSTPCSGAVGGPVETAWVTALATPRTGPCPLRGHRHPGRGGAALHPVRQQGAHRGQRATPR